jgi:hypothetical protein
LKIEKKEQAGSCKRQVMNAAFVANRSITGKGAEV